VGATAKISSPFLRNDSVSRWVGLSTIPDESVVEFVGVDVGDEMVVDIFVRSTPDELTLEMSGAVEGMMVITTDGRVLENTIEDRTLLRYIHADGGAAFEAAGFREASMADCEVAGAGAGLDCGAAAAKKFDPVQWGKYGVSGAGAGWTCYEWWNGPGEGEPQDPTSPPPGDPAGDQGRRRPRRQPGRPRPCRRWQPGRRQLARRRRCGRRLGRLPLLLSLA
jgi:hypothetical protein